MTDSLIPRAERLTREWDSGKHQGVLQEMRTIAHWSADKRRRLMTYASPQIFEAILARKIWSDAADLQPHLAEVHAQAVFLQRRKDYLTKTWASGMKAWEQAHLVSRQPLVMRTRPIPAEDPETWTPEGLAAALEARTAGLAAWWTTWEASLADASTPEATWSLLEAAQFDGTPALSLANAPVFLKGRRNRTQAQWRAFFAPLREAEQAEKARLTAERKAAREEAAEWCQANREQAAADKAEAAERAAWEATLLSVADIAAYAGCSDAVVRRAVQKGDIPVARRIAFSKWGQDLTTTRHTPEAVLAWGKVRGISEGRPLPMTAAQRRQQGNAIAAQNRTQFKLALKQVEQTRADALQHFPGGRWTMDGLLVPLMIEAGPPFQIWPAVWVTHWTSGGDLVADLTRWENALVADIARTLATWSPDHRAALTAYPKTKTVLSLPQPLTRLHPNQVSHPREGWWQTHLQRFWQAQALKMPLELPPQRYPQARSMKRQWKIFLGPTNSGKTYQAMQRLLAARSGVYLAPLRLMALEAHDTMVAQGLTCALQTGEEQRIHGEGEVTHVAATVESLNPERIWEVAVIDEAQMLADPERGWAWTQALLGVAAQTLCVCAAPEAEASLRALAQHLGEPLEIHRLSRETPLAVISQPVPLKQLTRGDALIGFSRAVVLAYRDLLRERGKTVACLYGDLGPEVRRREAARFANGEADILIATDAIGMGLNLPIRRVIFSAVDKYDGIMERPLTLAELKQIGGRAGRRGFHQAGEVRVLQDVSFKPLAAGLDRPVDAVSSRWPLQPRPEELLTLAQITGMKRVPELLDCWMKCAKRLSGPWNLAPTERWRKSPWTMTLAEMAPLELQLAYGGCPVRKTIEAQVLDWLRAHLRGERVPLPDALIEDTLDEYDTDNLAELERQAHLLTAYRWLSRRYPAVYLEGEALERQRTELHEAIAQALAKAGLARLCQECGTRLTLLAAKKGYRKCEDCFRPQRRGWDWEDDYADARGGWR